MKTQEGNNIERIKELKSNNVGLKLEISLLKSLMDNNELEYNKMRMNMHSAQKQINDMMENNNFAEYWRNKYQEELKKNRRLITQMN